jgi:hypothetical protein
MMFWISKYAFERAIADAVRDLQCRLAESEKTRLAMKEVEKPVVEHHAKCRTCGNVFHKGGGHYVFCHDVCRSEWIEGRNRRRAPGIDDGLTTDLERELVGEIDILWREFEATKDPVLAVGPDGDVKEMS